MSSLGYAANEYNVPVFLISHGSHTIGDDKLSNVGLSILERGLILSPFMDKTIAQSPLAYEAINKKVKTLSTINFLNFGNSDTYDGVHYTNFGYTKIFQAIDKLIFLDK